MLSSLRWPNSFTVLPSNCKLNVSDLLNRSMVGSSGLEPPTSRLSGARSNHLSYEPIKLNSVYLFTLAFSSALPTGGDDGIRTHDPLLAGQVLSQLSYTPMFP